MPSDLDANAVGAYRGALTFDCDIGRGPARAGGHQHLWR